MIKHMLLGLLLLPCLAYAMDEEPIQKDESNLVVTFRQGSGNKEVRASYFRYQGNTYMASFTPHGGDKVVRIYSVPSGSDKTAQNIYTRLQKAYDRQKKNQ